MSDISNEIYSSRDNIRNQLVTFLQEYLELDNVQLTRGSFLSYLINILGTLTSNLMFYCTSAYQEQFMTLAQLPESIYNLAAFLGYNARIASADPAVANVLITVPLTFTSEYPDGHVEFNIPEDHKFYSGQVVFIPDYSTSVTIWNNNSAQIEVTKDNKKYSLPFTIDTTTTNSLYFVLPLEQKEPRKTEYGNSFQYQIPSDLQTYQFVSLDIPFTEGELTDIEVYVTNPGETRKLYTRFSSIYLMTSESYGYVLQTIASGYRLYFGNGLMGIQPRAGATIDVEGYKTLGEDGNVIASSITQIDRIVVDDGSPTSKILNATITNTAPAEGGTNSEDIEEVRSNAIDNITTLGRLVTSDDYTKVDVVIPSSPIQDSISVLKRSDLKVNEIQLYTKVNFQNELVPSRNASTVVGPGVNNISAGDTIIQDLIQYRNLFDITIERFPNKIANYEYVVDSVEVAPSIQESYDISPLSSDLACTSFQASRSGDAINIYAVYETEESLSGITVILTPRQTGQNLSMTLDAPNNRFTYQFTSYTDLPDAPIQFYIKFYKSGNIFVQYLATVTIRQNLDFIMMSNIGIDGTDCTVYDIPVVKKSWYDDLETSEKTQFESSVIQPLINLEMTNYRMLTDFTNIKFTNTAGVLQNMKYNNTTKDPVIDIVATLPGVPGLADRYIVLEGDHANEIAECSNPVGPVWFYITPSANDIVYVTNKSDRYLYSEFGWVVPEYEIPLQITIEIFKNRSYIGTSAELASAIKTQLISDFTSRFGAHANIYRSEIIESIMGVDGVAYCRLAHPKSDIFFDFETTDLTQAQLLAYGPEYVYFTEDTISITVVGTVG
jgi:hypothetical protein